ncbi:hypothetical protein D3C72_1999940 [compost metagenome]
METGHAQAQVGDHQHLVDPVVAQDAVGEPGQPHVLWRVAQAPSQVGAAGDAFEPGRLAVEPAHQGFVVVLAVQHYHAPEQGVEWRRGAEQRLGLDALASQLRLDALLGHGLAGQGRTQIQGRQGQGDERRLGRFVAQAEGQPQ